MDLTRLAVLCQKVAKNQNLDEDMQAGATTLVAAWEVLQNRGQEPPYSEEALEEEMDDLAVRMAEFLLKI
jgi:hypothetical protein